MVAPMSLVSPPQLNSSTFESPDNVAAPVSPVSPPLNAQPFTNLEAINENRPIDPQSSPRADAQDFSTLETVGPADAARASAYNPDYRGHTRGPSDSNISTSYYAPGHSRGPSGSSLPPYQQNDTRFSTLPEAYHAPKEEPITSSNEDPEANNKEKAAVGGEFMKKRVCGLEMKAVLIIGIILLLVIIGAVVGGVAGSSKSKSSDKAIVQDPATAGAADTIAPEPTTSSAPVSLSASSTSSGTSTSSSSSTSTGGFAGPFEPLRTSDPAYLEPEDDYFKPDYWYSFSFFQSPLVIDASYDKNIFIGSPSIAVQADATKNQNWQIRPVPPFWANSSYKSDGFPKYTRAYWIANRNYGPGVRLALNDFDEDWKLVLRNRNTTPVYPTLQLIVADQQDRRQYWFFREVKLGNLRNETVLEAPTVYQVFNWAGQEQFRLAYNTTWEEPKLMSEETFPRNLDYWDIGEVGLVRSGDVPVGSDEEWITKVEEMPFRRMV